MYNLGKFMEEMAEKYMKYEPEPYKSNQQLFARRIMDLFRAIEHPHPDLWFNPTLHKEHPNYDVWFKLTPKKININHVQNEEHENVDVIALMYYTQVGAEVFPYIFLKFHIYKPKDEKDRPKFKTKVEPAGLGMMFDAEKIDSINNKPYVKQSAHGGYEISFPTFMQHIMTLLMAFESFLNKNNRQYNILQQRKKMIPAKPSKPAFSDEDEKDPELPDKHLDSDASEEDIHKAIQSDRQAARIWDSIPKDETEWTEEVRRKCFIERWNNKNTYMDMIQIREIMYAVSRKVKYSIFKHDGRLDLVVSGKDTVRYAPMQIPIEAFNVNPALLNAAAPLLASGKEYEIEHNFSKYELVGPPVKSNIVIHVLKNYNLIGSKVTIEFSMYFLYGQEENFHLVVRLKEGGKPPFTDEEVASATDISTDGILKLHKDLLGKIFMRHIKELQRRMGG